MNGPLHYPTNGLQRGKIPHSGECLDMTLNNLMVSPSNAGALYNAELPFIAIALRPDMVAPDRVLSLGQIELNLCSPDCLK